MSRCQSPFHGVWISSAQMPCRLAGRPPGRERADEQVAAEVEIERRQRGIGRALRRSRPAARSVGSALLAVAGRSSSTRSNHCSVIAPAAPRGARRTISAPPGRDRSAWPPPDRSTAGRQSRGSRSRRPAAAATSSAFVDDQRFSVGLHACRRGPARAAAPRRSRPCRRGRR